MVIRISCTIPLSNLWEMLGLLPTLSGICGQELETSDLIWDVNWSNQALTSSRSFIDAHAASHDMVADPEDNESLADICHYLEVAVALCQADMADIEVYNEVSALLAMSGRDVDGDVQNKNNRAGQSHLTPSFQWGYLSNRGARDGFSRKNQSTEDNVGVVNGAITAIKEKVISGVMKVTNFVKGMKLFGGNKDNEESVQKPSHQFLPQYYPTSSGLIDCDEISLLRQRISEIVQFGPNPLGSLEDLINEMPEQVEQYPSMVTNYNNMLVFQFSSDDEDNHTPSQEERKAGIHVSQKPNGGWNNFTSFEEFASFVDNRPE